jgi:hypothetical protein
MRRVLIQSVALALLVLSVGRATAGEHLMPLAQPGPWSGVSGLIGYGDRLWLVNSVKVIDHNSADVYSYDPRTGALRYERHLFSQDAGDPAVAFGRLYWPFEDARFSAGRGEYVVTNGREWQWRILPHGEVFHVHAMAVHGEAIYAATSAWRAGLQRSKDGGVSWQVLYEHPAPPGSVSRITTLAALGGSLYAGLTAPGPAGPRLLRLIDRTLVPDPGWPSGLAVTGLRACRGWLYGLHTTRDDTALWRTDGRRAERVTALDGHAVRALAEGRGGCWTVTAESDGGRLWRSVDGRSWTEAYRFHEAEPLDVTVYAGDVYVGTTGPGGRGTLWGPPAPAGTEPALVPGPLPTVPAKAQSLAVSEAATTLDDALAAESSFVTHAARLRAAVEPLALDGSAEAADALVRRLTHPVPDVRVALFGGALVAPAAKVAHWYLLWAIGLAGRGHVPLPLLAAPWTAQTNRAEKYLDPAPAAAWTAAQVGQRDDATLGTLVGRLGAPDQPAWLDGDLAGALTSLTGQRFGYDLTAWRQWWARR